MKNSVVICIADWPADVSGNVFGNSSQGLEFVPYFNSEMDNGFIAAIAYIVTIRTPYENHYFCQGTGQRRAPQDSGRAPDEGATKNRSERCDRVSSRKENQEA